MIVSLWNSNVLLPFSLEELAVWIGVVAVKFGVEVESTSVLVLLAGKVSYVIRSVVFVRYTEFDRLVGVCFTNT